MHTNKHKQRLLEPQPLEPGTIICLHPVFLDLEPVSADRLAAQRATAEKIAQALRRMAIEDETEDLAQALRRMAAQGDATPKD
jgi:hypothetical protein